MTIEDTFNGAKNAMILYYAYFNSVAEEIGMERALALTTKTNEAMGAMNGKQMKEAAGIEEFNAKEAASLARNSIQEAYGISTEVIEESPLESVFKVGKCPVYEAALELGMNPQDIEAECRIGSLRFMDKIVKQLNPNLNYQLRKFRSASDDFCEEAIVMT